MMWEWNSAWGWWWMCVGMLVFWGLVAWLAVTLVRQGGRRRRDSRVHERSSTTATHAARPRTTNTAGAPS
jgi:peptidoglycan/LPS O-acetylase OafA/YrhL